jgi:putative ABC transport system permease protein
MIPFTTMQRTYNMGDVVHFFSVTSVPGVPVSRVEERLKELLKERHHISPDDLAGHRFFQHRSGMEKIQCPV